MFGPTTYGATFGAALLAGAAYLWPALPFMAVSDVQVTIAGEVTAIRTIRREVIADWRVTIVEADLNGPSCQTRTGPGQDQGWSHYVPGKTQSDTMTMDVWAGVPGCWDRLQAGTYKMFVTWTPRDDSPAVTFSGEFEKGSSE